MKKYLQIFHRTKDLFLNFCTAKTMFAEANCEDRDSRKQMANQSVNAARQNTAAKHARQVDHERLERANQPADLILRENHFSFIKMHYFTRFAFHIRPLGYISMYSTDISQLEHKE